MHRVDTPREGRRQDERATIGNDAADLPHGRIRIGHVLEHLGTEHEVEGPAGERQDRRVTPHVRGGEQIGGDVATVREQVGIWSPAAAQVEDAVGGPELPGDATDLVAKASSGRIQDAGESVESGE